MRVVVLMDERTLGVGLSKQLTRQERAHASVVEVDPLAVGAFIGRCASLVSSSARRDGLCAVACAHVGHPATYLKKCTPSYYDRVHSVGAGETRVGLLFGSVEAQAPKAAKQPVRGRSSGAYASSSEAEDGRAKVVVRVAAVMEVDASFQQHGCAGHPLWSKKTRASFCLTPNDSFRSHSPGHRLDDRGLYHHYHHSPAASASSSSGRKTGPTPDDTHPARNPDVARAVEVASFMGLSPVGWVVARPGGVLAAGGALAIVERRGVGGWRGKKEGGM